MFGQWGSIGFLVAEEGGKGGHQGREYKMIRSQHRSSETKYLFNNYNYNVNKLQFSKCLESGALLASWWLKRGPREAIKRGLYIMICS